MKKNYLLFMVFCVQLFFSIAAKAQSWQWGNQASSVEAEGWLAAADKYGNSFACGTFLAPGITFGTYYLTTSYKINTFLVKYSPSGNVVWAKQITGGSAPMGITTDTSGNLYMLGTFDTTATIGSITLTDASITPYKDKYFLAKFDKNGNVLWAKQGVNSLMALYPHSTGIVTDASGHFYITLPLTSDTSVLAGDTIISKGSRDVLVAKYDLSGNLLWHRQFGGSLADESYGLAINNKGSLYISGATQSTSIQFGTAAVTGGSNDVFVAKMDTAGNFLWMKRGQGSGYTYSGSIATDTFDNAFITGSYNGSTILFTSIPLFNAGTGCIFLTKYDGTGAVAWAKNITASGPNSLSGPKGFSVVTDPCNNIWMCGSPIVADTVDIGGTKIYPPATSTDPVFIAGFRQDGTLFQTTALASGGDDPYLGDIIACDRAGNIYLASDNTNSKIVVGQDTLVSSITEEQPYMTKYSPGLECGSLEPTEVPQVASEDQLTIFPNPASTSFTISVEGNLDASAVMQLFSIDGRLMLAQELQGNETKVNTNQLAAGIYFCLIRTDGSHIVSRKVVIMK